MSVFKAQIIAGNLCSSHRRLAADALNKRTSIDAPQRIFFPVAAFYAACLPALSLWAMFGSGTPPVLSSPSGHAHEMLFGFALAVVAGYALGPQPRWRLAILVLCWVSARCTDLFWPHNGFTVLLNIAFPGLLAWHLIPRFAKSAKKWRNQALAPLLAALCAMAVVASLAPVLKQSAWVRPSEFAAVLLFTLLMVFMGGRMIAPAVAGQIQRQGGVLEARVQPRIEGALILSLAAAVLILPISSPLTALILLLSALLVAIRMLRWRLWACRGRPDLQWLGMGYGWLSLGLGLLGAGLIGWLSPMAGIHAISVGAMGTLTLTVMGRTRLLRLKLDPARSRLMGFAVSLVTLATLLRLIVAVGSEQMPFGYGFLWGAAVAWALAFLMLAGGLLFWRQAP